MQQNRENDVTYKQLVNHLYRLKTKWDIHIIDVYNNDELNKLAKSDKEMMADDSHPTKKRIPLLVYAYFSKTIRWDIIGRAAKCSFFYFLWLRAKRTFFE